MNRHPVNHYFLCGVMVFGMLIQACSQSKASNLILIDGNQKIPLLVSQIGNAKSYSDSQKASAGEIADPSTLETQSNLLDQMVLAYQKNRVVAAKGDRYNLSSPALVSAASCLFLSVATNAPVLVCELYETDNPGPQSEQLLYPPAGAPGNGIWSFRIPLYDLKELVAFRLSTLNGKSGFSITAVELKTDESNFYSRLQAIVPAGLRVFQTKTAIQCDLPSYQFPVPSVSWLDLGYSFTAVPESGPKTVELQAIGMSGALILRKKIWTLRLRPGTQHIQLYIGSLGFVPNRLLLNGVPSSFQLNLISPENRPVSTGLSIDNQNSTRFSAPEPLPADLWSLLNYPQENWRQNFFEVFSWNLFPEILIVDFGSLEIQDRFVKRLVFFAEKRGYRGTLQKNAVIEPLHGWNANDFSAQTLADFFTVSERQKFPLNKEEILLRECLLQWGIIAVKGALYVPVKGGLLSVARGQQMTDSNRSLLLQHECLHGVFFARESFRRTCEEAFTTMNPIARDFMMSYFSFYQYDPADHYLMVNEMQAYLLQQPLSTLKSYLTINMVRAYSKVHPERELAFRKQAEGSSAALHATAQYLSTELFRQTGLINGQMACLLSQN